MLKERVEITGAGFRVQQDKGGDRQAYYGTFTLADDVDSLLADRKLKMSPAHYFSPLNPGEVHLENPGFVVVVEQQEGKIVDQYRFYYRGNGYRPSLNISDEADRKYGANAHRITIEWDEDSTEPISSSYIWLEDGDGSRYEFLTDLFEPEEKKRKWVDEYIYQNDIGADVSVKVSELVEAKYDVTIS